jgi:hypothetical protein
MKKAFNLLLALVAVMGIVSLFSVNEASAQYTKQTLIEQHTGAWCGWCVDGSYVMDEIIKQYPTKVMGIKVHNGDAMVVPEQGEIGSALGLTGFPTGNVNRTAFNVGGTNAIFLDRGAWKSAVEAVMNLPVEAGVEAYYSYDPATREVAAIVNVEFVKSVTGEVRLNAIVLEDKVTGTGNQYDQSNYLSGRAGYESNPYYSKPAKIVGYEHMKVVRSFMGGAWGQPNSITGATTAGKKYSYSFKYTLPAGYNPANISVIGVVQKFTTSARDVLNCIKATQATPQLQLTSAGENIQVKASGTTGSVSYSVKNITAGALTITATVNKTSRTPSDWTVAIEPAATEFTLAAGETKTIILKLTPGATKGLGDASVSFKDKNSAKGIAMSGDLSVLSSEINKFQVIDDGEAGKYTLAGFISNAGYTDFFDISADDFNKFSSALSASKSTLVWSSGEMGDISADDATSLGAFINQGGNVLIAGAITIQTGSTTAKGLLSTFGIQFLKTCFQGQGSGAINLKGYTGDEITDGFASGAQLINYLTPAIRILNAAVSTPIIKHTSVDTLVAVKSIFTNSRGVWLGINPATITNSTQKQNLIKKALDWLNGTSAPKEPQIEFDQSTVGFDLVNTGSEKNITLVITNTGGKDLQINSMTLDPDYDTEGVFTIKSGGSPNPIILAPGATRDIVLNFQPKGAKKYFGQLRVKSNSTNDNDQTISLTGEGVSVGAAKIQSTKTTLRYNSILLGKSPIADVDITNDGIADLIISSIAITDDADGVFSIVSGGEAGTILSNESRTITIKFAPKTEKSFTGNLTILSNALNSPDFKVSLQGQGVTTVPEEVTSPDGIVNVKVFPNPMTSNGVITYKINSNEAVQFNMYIVDMNGRKVADLVNTLTTGSQSLQFDASSINSGTYFIVAGANSSVAKLPFIITK